MRTLVDIMEGTINEYKMINEGDTIVVGLSGGPDSLCLLHALLQIRDKYNIKIVAAHLNHSFRGDASDRDMEYVRKICRDWDIEVVIRKADIGLYAREQGISSETAGREARYMLFDEVAKKYKANKIAVAHNKNDNVETVLMRIMRGTGLNGLSGISPVRDNIIRPLISISRATIEKYCEDYKLNPCIDHTNSETIYTRNKVRLELIPYIEENFNPNFMETINRFSEQMQIENDFLEKETKSFYKKLAIIHENEVKYDIAIISKLDMAIKRRLVIRAIAEVKGDALGIEQKHIELVIGILDQKTGAAIYLTDDIRAYISYGFIIIKKGQTVNDCEKTLKLTVLSMDELTAYKSLNEKNVIYIDGDAVVDKIVLRSRKKNDRFTPLGMKGSKKISAYMVDEKIPKEIRDTKILIADGSQIICIIDKPISELYKVTKKTKKIVEIRLMGE